MTQPFALILEDDRKVAAMFRHILSSAGFHAQVVSDTQAVLERLTNDRPWLIVLDLDLPGASGNQILKTIRNDETLRQIKVIALTSYSQIADSLSVEPDLLLFKPISAEQVSDFIERFQLKVKYQTTVPMLGEPWDRVTGLYNQSFFKNRLESSLVHARETDHHIFAVLTINLDPDEKIRNQIGIREWISLLRATAETLKTAAGPSDTVARFDQDNFYVLIDDVVDGNSPMLAASHIHQELKDKFARLGRQDQFPIRIGVLVCDRAYEDIDEVLREAKIAHSLEDLQRATLFDNRDRISIRF
jgi:diguanylate cyclase (GGDEF)-like protein